MSVKPDDEVYDSELIRVLLGNQKYTRPIFLYRVLPWAMYFLVMQNYLNTQLTEYGKGFHEGDGFEFLQRLFCLASISFYGVIEMITIKKMGIGYLRGWNTI